VAPTTYLSGTTPITNVPSAPTTTYTPIVTAAADRIGAGAGALGLVAGIAALVL